MRRATRCCGIAFHSSCTKRRKSARLVFSSTRRSTARFACSVGHPPSKDTHLFATFEMGYPFIQSVLIQALKQLWDSNHDSSVAMTQLFMCAKDHFDWLNNFGNMRPNPNGNLFSFNCLHHYAQALINFTLRTFGRRQGGGGGGGWNQESEQHEAKIGVGSWGPPKDPGSFRVLDALGSIIIILNVTEYYF